MTRRTVADLIQGYDAPVARLVDQYFRENEAARTALDLANRAGRPFVIDHITIRTRRVDARAREFTDLGFEYRDELIEYPDQGWWAKVYRKAGMPAVFIDQAYDDARGGKSLLPAWVDRFGDQALHHVAIRVPDIEKWPEPNSNMPGSSSRERSWGRVARACARSSPRPKSDTVSRSRCWSWPSATATRGSCPSRPMA